MLYAEGKSPLCPRGDSGAISFRLTLILSSERIRLYYILQLHSVRLRRPHDHLIGHEIFDSAIAPMPIKTIKLTSR
jgi:hypothetical protein